MNAYRPRKDIWQNFVTGSIGLCILFFLLIKVPDSQYFIGDPDGGHQLTGAMQVLHGEHPFINFRSTYGPLTFYASALGQILSGNRLFGEIALIIIGYWIAYLLLYKLLREAGKTWIISVACLCFALILFPRFYKYYIVLGPVLTLYVAWKYIENKNIITLFFLAAAIAFTGLYRFDFGVYAIICGLSTIFVVHHIRDAEKVFKPGGLLLLFILLCASPWLLWALFKGGIINYFSDTFSGIVHQSKGLALPFPRFIPTEPITTDANIIFVLYVFFHSMPVLALATLYAVRKRLQGNEKYKMIVAIIFGQLVLVQAMHRCDFGHLLQAVPVCLALIAWMIHSVTCDYSKMRWPVRAVSAAILILFVFMGCGAVILCKNSGMLPERKNILEVCSNIRSLTGTNSEIIAALKALHPKNEYVQIIEYIKQHSLPDEKILAIPFSASLYYFSDRIFGGGQMLLAPGYFSLPNDQVLMVKRLREERIPLIVEVSGFCYKANETIDDFASMVNKYINDNYEDSYNIGIFVVKTPLRGP